MADHLEALQQEMGARLRKVRGMVPHMRSCAVVQVLSACGEGRAGAGGGMHSRLIRAHGPRARLLGASVSVLAPSPHPPGILPLLPPCQAGVTGDAYDAATAPSKGIAGAALGAMDAVRAAYEATLAERLGAFLDDTTRLR